MLAIEKKIQSELKQLANHMFHETHELAGWKGMCAEYLAPGEYEYLDNGWFDMQSGTRYGKNGITVFMKNTLDLDSSYIGKKVVLLIKFGGEGCLSVNGKHYNGLDYNRYIIPIADNAKGNEHFDLEAEINCKDMILDSAYFSSEGMMISLSEVGVLDEDTWKCYHKFKTAYDYAADYPESFARAKGLNAIYDAILTLDYSSETTLDETCQTAVNVLENNLSKIKNIRIPEVVYAIGHSHIDIAWHWPLKETYRKTSRTFSSALRLMENYPHFRFSQSMPCLYEMAEKYYPEIFAQIKERVAQNRWETLGCMYLEPDCNLISGESFVRQIMHGKKYWKEKFNSDSNVCFLPDTFGFSPAMPQILKKTGTKYFFTSKLAWQETNRFPHSVFWWKGLDGSMVLSGMQLMYDWEKPKLYNGDGSPRGVLSSLKDFRSKEEEVPMMYLYGHGDGGGGVTAEMLEHFEAAPQLPFTPTYEMGFVSEYFDAVNSEAEKHPLAVWDGPLYFEKHRGTYTSQAKNKRNNRKCEFLYRNAELLSVLNYISKKKYNSDLGKGWRLILLNQFHDILPGTASDEVYITSEKQYTEIKEMGETVISENLQYLRVENGGFSVFNPLSWKYSTVVNKIGCEDKVITDENGQIVPQVHNDDGSIDFYVKDIEAFGVRTFYLKDSDTTEKKEKRLSYKAINTGRFIIDFTDDGEISRLFDMEADREILQDGKTGNKFALLEDIPVEWGSSWETTMKRFDKPSLKFFTEKFELTDNNDLYVKLELTRKCSGSTIIQDIRIYKQSGIIEFKTKVDWNEYHKMLRVEFPVALRSMNVDCDCAFGHFEMPNHRTTPYDEAKFEICAHKWVDLSEGNYGVALLNDSIYGHIVNDSVMSLSLLRSPDNPAKNCDKGIHEFTYYLYPHSGNLDAAAIPNVGYELNNGVMVLDCAISESLSQMISIDNSSVIIDTVKISEDGKSVIIRCYEAYGNLTKCTIRFGFSAVDCFETDLLENNIQMIALEGSQIQFEIKPFEIKTFRVNLH